MGKFVVLWLMVGMAAASAEGSEQAPQAPKPSPSSPWIPIEINQDDAKRIDDIINSLPIRDMQQARALSELFMLKEAEAAKEAAGGKK